MHVPLFAFVQVPLFVFVCVWKCDILLQFVRWAVTGRGQRGNAGQLLRGAKILQEASISREAKAQTRKQAGQQLQRSHNFARTQANIKHTHEHEQWMRGTRFLQHSGVNRKPTKIKINHRQRVNEMLVRSVSISLFKSVAKSGNNFAEVARCQPGLLTKSLWVWLDWGIF